MFTFSAHGKNMVPCDNIIFTGEFQRTFQPVPAECSIAWSDSGCMMAKAFLKILAMFSVIFLLQIIAPYPNAMRILQPAFSHSIKISCMQRIQERL
jgi:hypothetical protein